MPFYYKIDNREPSGRRTAQRLLRLKKHLANEIPRRTFSDTLLLATWNIREFDSKMYGARLDESFYYIAEIISHFDIVAIQEVRDDLSALKKTCRILGGWWDYIVTDVTEGSSGNKERMAFVFDKRKIRFGGLAGEIVLPPRKKDGEKIYVRQFARTPFMVGLQAGWFRFVLSSIHAYYGISKPNDPTRLAEIKHISEFLAKRSHNDTAWSKNIILLGDFNIFSTDDETFKAIESAGFMIPEQLRTSPSNVAKKPRHFDQIAFMVDSGVAPTKENPAGVFHFYDDVFLEDDEDDYIEAMGNAYYRNSDGETRDEKQKTRYYNMWRTHQMSDHNPMWIELKIDFGEEYLQAKARKPNNDE